ncbi:hypothetical protein L204_105664 [Cryptococcus depauperatus]|nr:hypothetical protein L204_02568 [Cryptococcus depauperatus CBS 7855]
MTYTNENCQPNFSPSSQLPMGTYSSSPDGGGVGKIDLGLARMLTIMSALRPLSVPAIHLSGTNGKGSVSAMVEYCLVEAGLNVARYNSPHLLEPRDAIRINGQLPSQEMYCEAVNLVKKLDSKSKLGATSFEIATASAYWLINNAEPPIDVMIIECGLGGAKDATNIIPSEWTLASALTSVGLDHTSFLGETVSEITMEKAYIASKDALFILGEQKYQEVLPVAIATAERQGARVIKALSSKVISTNLPPMSLIPFRPPPPVSVRTALPALAHIANASSILVQLSLPGCHQLNNLSIALAILHAIRCDPRARRIQPRLARLTDEAVQRGIASCRWEGRCSWLEWSDGPSKWPVLVDGAHNADSSRVLREYINSLSFEGPLLPVRFIVSLSNSPGKSIDSILSPLLQSGDEVEFVEFTTPVEGMPWVKPVSCEEAARIAVNLITEKAIRIGGKGTEGVKQALRAARDDKRMTVVCGSLYLVADVYRILSG